jgi:hypothetical protein
MARARIASLDAKIAELQRARQSLARLAKECAAGDKGPCPDYRLVRRRLTGHGAARQNAWLSPTVKRQSCGAWMPFKSWYSGTGDLAAELRLAGAGERQQPVEAEARRDNVAAVVLLPVAGAVWLCGPL